MKLSVVIPTHNPQQDILALALESLKAQSLAISAWELIVIDNRSDPPIQPELLDWHPHGRVTTEPNLGLTPARFKGIQEAQSEIIVFCDDDNVLDSNYLEHAYSILTAEPQLGMVGGKSLPDYLSALPTWYEPGLPSLGCRNLGSTSLRARWINGQPKHYPSCSPIGAGMVARAEVLRPWMRLAAACPKRKGLDRAGEALTSGGDNDITLTALNGGWTVGYEPGLILKHLIPPARLTVDYQCRIAFATFRDFIKVLDLHGIRPWSAIPRFLVPLLGLRAWLLHRAWRSPASCIRWHGWRGQFTGRSGIQNRATELIEGISSQAK